MAKTKNSKNPPPLSLRLDDELNDELETAMQATRLSKSDLARLSIERGLKIVLKQLTTPVAEAA